MKIDQSLPHINAALKQNVYFKNGYQQSTTQSRVLLAYLLFCTNTALMFCNDEHSVEEIEGFLFESFSPEILWKDHDYYNNDDICFQSDYDQYMSDVFNKTYDIWVSIDTDVTQQEFGRNEPTNTAAAIKNDLLELQNLLSKEF